jgi:hypothetical protein
MSGNSTSQNNQQQLYLEIGEKKYELRPAPLKMLKKIWAALPKVTGNADKLSAMIREAGGAEKVSNEEFMKTHAARVDVIVELLCAAAGIQVQEAEDNMTRDQVENLTAVFNKYLEISGFLKDESPNGPTGPLITGPIASTETGTRSQLN